MATLRMSRKPGDVRIEREGPLTQRSMRQPRFDYLAKHGAGALYPVVIAPVMAGDTLKGSTMMARIVGAPSEQGQAASVTGSWFETWLFYVRIGDLPRAEDVRNLIVDPDFVPATPVDFREQCMASIWKAYFIDEAANGETPPPWDASADALNFLNLPGNGWWDSVAPNADLPAPEAGDDEWQTQWVRYQALRRAKLTQATYEEYLAKSGISVPPQLRVDHDADMKVPELLKWTREFAYPQPAGYASTSASNKEVFRTQWFIQQKVDRSRFCAEPGFLVSCVAVRPKMYRLYDRSIFDPLDVLQDASGWMPTDFDSDPHASLINIPAEVIGDTIPAAEATLDIRDTWVYGDQVLGSDFTLTDDRVVALSRNDRYVADVYEYSIDLQVRHSIASRVHTDTTS